LFFGFWPRSFHNRSGGIKRNTFFHSVDPRTLMRKVSLSVLYNDAFISKEKELEKPKPTELPNVEAKLSSLKQEADQFINDPIVQAKYLRELNQSNPKAVLARIDQFPEMAMNNEVIKEIVRALLRVQKLEELSGNGVDNNSFQNDSTLSSSSNSSKDSFWTALRKEIKAKSESGNEGGKANRPLVSSSDEFAGSSKKPLNVVIMRNWKDLFFSALGGIVVISVFIFLFTRGSSIGDMFKSDMTNNVEPHVTTTFDDVKGNAEAKEELSDIVEFLKNPAKFLRLNVQLPKGVLLVGPPGCGKTLMARALAGEAGVPFYYASGSEFEEMLVGVGAKRVRSLFAKAKQTAPCIVFIDEIDAIGGRRDVLENRMKMTLNQLLVELDGFRPNEHVVVVAATNLPEVLDPALTRPGRFDRQVTVDLPDLRARQEILSLYLANRQTSEVDLNHFAKSTVGFSGADLFNMVNLAAIQATKQNKRQISQSLLYNAWESVMMGPERKSLMMTPEAKRITAFHESGHALVALYTKGDQQIIKATLLPRGHALGMVSYLPKDELFHTKEEMLGRIEIAMAGRAAEELIFGENRVTQGAGSDFQQATRIASNMITSYGMGRRLGHLAFNKEQQKELGEETRAMIDLEVREILENSYQRAKQILLDHRAQLHLLANALLEYESLTYDEIKAVIDQKDIKEIKKQKSLQEEKLRLSEESNALLPLSALPSKLNDEATGNSTEQPLV